MLQIEFFSDKIELIRQTADRLLDPKTRSQHGQFMTAAPIARYMASLFSQQKTENIRLLDAGAGIGSLTAAFIEEFCHRSAARSITATLYEIDEVMARHLPESMQHAQELTREYNIDFHYRMRQADFINSVYTAQQHTLFPAPAETYTHAILNPPYKKIGSDSVHRLQLRSMGIEASNLYAAFIALAIRMLEEGGEIVAIIPRSFCNGPYFKPFRQLLLSTVAIRKIHVFESRDKAFKDNEVLQENIIIHAVKGAVPDKVSLYSSHNAAFGREDRETTVEDLTCREIPYSSLVKNSDPEQFIHITTNDLEQQVVEQIAQFQTTLDQLAVEVSTGPVVDFRMLDSLKSELEADSVPLLYPQHFIGGSIVWPLKGKKPNAIAVNDETRRWLYPNEGHFVVVKRFSSKEEKKRIVASVYDSSLSGALVGFENHLNVFHQKKRGMSRELAWGIAGYLNTSLADRFFRQFNGHTQVNATDLRMFRYPDPHRLTRLGQQIANRNLSQQELDNIFNQEVNQMAETAGIDPIQAQQKIDEALAILKALGMPRGQNNERSALTLLALLNLKPSSSWQEIERQLWGITPIMDFCRKYYGRNYAPNTRETFRRQTMHQFVDAAIAVYNPDKPDRPVNSPKACYQVSVEAFDAIIKYQTPEWEDALDGFLVQKPALSERYAKVRDMQMIPLEIEEGKEIKLTPGAHSELIWAVIKEFGTRFVQDGMVIYVGDTGDKVGYFRRDKLAELGVEVDKHGKMPDVVLYDKRRNWLLLIEAVTSHGPVDDTRYGELTKLFQNSTAGLVYITAFPDKPTMAPYLSRISWETEVWVAKEPTHMVHFNGVRFLGPYTK